ncbi:uncharacterized protein LOC144926708 [Branchiostoma floridae x Branchiostoma belcheri]
MRNPGQSRVWTSAVKKTISVLSLVLNCCLLGVVIFLVVTVLGLKLSVNQLEEEPAANMSSIKLSVSQLEEKTAAKLSDIKLSVSQLEEKTASKLSDIKLSVSQSEEKTAAKLSDIKLSISQLNSEHLKLDSSVTILQGKSDALFAALKPFKKWRDDLKCGPGFRTEDGYPAECNPDSRNPCCSPHNWCDVTPKHCDCRGCIDYRKRP